MVFSSEKLGEAIGFVVMYFIFTTILYFLLIVLEKFPDSWTFLHIIAITLTIVLFGILLKLWVRN